MSDAGSPELAALRGLGEEWGRALAGSEPGVIVSSIPFRMTG